MSPRRDDVIVIGAGLSGLMAARELEAAGRSVRVLEARDRVGGRTWTRSLRGHPIDLGGQWVGPTQDRVLALARELGIETYEQFDRGRKVMELGGQRSTYRGLLPWVGLGGLAELGLRVGQLELMARRIPLRAPAERADASALDGQTVRAWLDRRVRNPKARAVLRIATEMVFAGEPEDLSLLFFLFYMHSGGGFVRLTSIRGGAQAQRLKGGAQGLSRRMAEALATPVEHGQAVHAVLQEPEGVVVHAGNRSLRARHAIVAVPPALAAEIDLGPARSERRRRAEQGMPMGSVVKCIVVYPRPFWREAGLSGESISDGEPIRATFDGCSPDLSFCALVAFVIGGSAGGFGARPSEERRALVVEHLVRLFGAEAAEPVAYEDQDWSQEAWSRGCYVGLMRPGVLAEVGNVLREPAGRVRFAGTETAARWCGYFDGALRAGERAAQEVLEAMRAEVPGDV
ncbi:MAG: FAD-dependent oxidoreductase [Myxococcales bacterium]|nr:FAD-dependent oxidoreductase [Myxococcales bacterium]